jgi:hypothetical protein
MTFGNDNPERVGVRRDALIVKADRQEALVIVRMSLATEIARAG